MHHFQEIRQRLADTRAVLRQAKDQFEVARAEAEQAAVDAGLAGGKNAEERSRSLTLALQKDPAYTGALSRLRSAEAECERVEALLESARDERRAGEWQIRMRLADALFHAGVQSDDADPGDGAIDDIYDEQAARAASNYSATLRRQQAPPNGTEEYEKLPF